MMKRLMILAAMMVVALPIMAATEVVDGITWTYTVSNGKASVGGGGRLHSSSSAAVPVSTSGAITIPSTLGGYPVTSIGNYALYNCTNLTSVTIPNGVTSIGSSAFSGCSGLASVTIPGGVTSIGNYAFSGCSGLTSVTIPDSVTSIGDSAFDGCSGLTSVHITDIAKWCSISFGGFSANPLCYAHNLYLNGAEVTDLTIPDSVTSIRSYAFYGCSGLTSVTIPDSVTSIGDYAFYNCSGLTSVTIPDSVTSIGSYAFRGCSGLTSVTIPNSVTSIGSDAFYGCNAIARVDYWCAPPENVQYASILGKGVQRYSREYGAQWQKIRGINNFYGYLTAAAPKVEIVSSSIRENDPTIMDVVYKVTSSKPTVKVRALAFEDGERSFAKVVRPETFIEGTAANVGDEVAANVEHTLSWQVSSDWQTRLAKLKFEVLVCEGELLPMEWMTIPASETYGKMKVSWNAHNASQVFDALLWLYADKDPGLTLASGVLRSGSTQLASGTGTSNPNAIRYIYSKMGYDLLSGAALNYINEETRLGLSPSGVRQYAYKIVEDAQ